MEDLLTGSVPFEAAQDASHISGNELTLYPTGTWFRVTGTPDHGSCDGWLRKKLQKCASSHGVMLQASLADGGACVHFTRFHESSQWRFMRINP